MGLSVAAGTETLQAHSFGDADATQDLIVGDQHHIYTVLSTIVYSVSIGSGGDTYQLVIKGHDHHAGADTNASIMVIVKVNSVAGQTFVFNDKFSFNGFGAANYSEPYAAAATGAGHIATQGGTLQRYQYIPLDADVDCDIHVTFIDQNNA
jgi:hypothetical protein